MDTTPPARPAPTRQTTDTSLAPPAPVATAPGRKLYSAAVTVGLAFVLSRLLGQARELIIAHQFGTEGEIAAYLAAFRIPDLLFQVVMAGAFGSAFVPVFAGFLDGGEIRKAWRLASNVLTIMVEAFVAASAVAFLFADPLVRFFVAPGLSPELQRTTVELTRILLLSNFLLGLGAAAKGMLESFDNFTLPAFAPVGYNLAAVAGALVLAPRYGVKGLAWGIVAGAAAHVLIQLPGLVRAGARFQLMPKPVAEGIGTVGRLIGPRVLGQAAFPLNFAIITSIASRLDERIIPALSYAYQLVQLPHGLFAIAVSTVIFPLMARQYAARDFAALKQTLGDALRPLLFLTLPASAALMILARPIVQVVFQRGEFGPESTALVAGSLPAFAAGLFALAIVETIARAFYAMQDTRTPLLASLATIAATLALAAVLGPRLGGRGLAASISITTGLEMAVLLTTLRRRIGPFDPAVWRSFVTSLAATAAMAGALLLIREPLTTLTDPADPRAGGTLGRVILFAVAAALGLYIYLAAAWFLRAQELTELAGRLRRRT